VTQTVAAFRQLETIWRQVELGLLGPEALSYFGWSSDDTFLGGSTARLWPRIREYMNDDFAAFVEAQGGVPGG
jgi:hypothetical protein